jgi:hypothetical protein
MLHCDSLNWGAVIVAALAGYFPGAIWYSPLGFLRPWARELGIDLVNPPAVKHAGAKIAFGLVPALIAATALALILGHPTSLAQGLATGATVGAGCVATSLGIQYLYENRSVTFWLINAGYHLLQFLIMSAVLTLWPW